MRYSFNDQARHMRCIFIDTNTYIYILNRLLEELRESGVSFFNNMNRDLAAIRLINWKIHTGQFSWDKREYINARSVRNSWNYRTGAILLKHIRAVLLFYIHIYSYKYILNMYTYIYIRICHCRWIYITILILVYIFIFFTFILYYIIYICMYKLLISFSLSFSLFCRFSSSFGPPLSRRRQWRGSMYSYNDHKRTWSEGATLPLPHTLFSTGHIEFVPMHTHLYIYFIYVYIYMCTYMFNMVYLYIGIMFRDEKWERGRERERDDDDDDGGGGYVYICNI